MTETVDGIRADDLRLLMDYAGMDIPVEDGEHEVNIALARCAEALDKDGSEEESGTAPEPELPPGVYARIELPGYRNHTGWVTEQTRFGAQVAVVCDWDGREMAAVAFGPACQIIYLPTPLRRPEVAIAMAIEAGAEPQVGDWAYDEADGPGEGSCICGPDSTGETDERPDCPVHGDPF